MSRPPAPTGWASGTPAPSRSPRGRELAGRGGRLAGAAAWAGFDVVRVVVGCAVAVVVVLAWCAGRSARFGGVTGDVFGAAIELALATLLLASAEPRV